MSWARLECTDAHLRHGVGSTSFRKLERTTARSLRRESKRTRAERARAERPCAEQSITGEAQHITTVARYYFDELSEV